MEKISSNLSAHGEIVKERLSTLDTDIKDAKTASQSAETAARNVGWNNITMGIALIGAILVIRAI